LVIPHAIYSDSKLCAKSLIAVDVRLEVRTIWSLRRSRVQESSGISNRVSNAPELPERFCGWRAEF